MKVCLESLQGLAYVWRILFASRQNKKRKVPLIWELPFPRCAMRFAETVVLVKLAHFHGLATCVVLEEYWRYLQGVSALSYPRILLPAFAGPVIKRQPSRCFGNISVRRLITTWKTRAINFAPGMKKVWCCRNGGRDVWSTQLRLLNNSCQVADKNMTLYNSRV